MPEKAKTVRITESPRDAMQGLKYFIPTGDKARYLNALLQVGFDIVDFGSFVSPKAIPQFSDIADLIEMIEPGDSPTRLLTIVGNARWGEEAAKYSKISWLGFPFSVSPTFQKMNLNRSQDDSLDAVKQLLEIAERSEKKLRIYLSMAFGNPYGDAWSIDLVLEWALKLKTLGVKHFAISDTVGLSEPESISKLFSLALKEFPSLDFGFHLHTRKSGLHQKIQSAWDAGCRNFDSVLNGVGGCPLSGYELIGNLDTMELIGFFDKKNVAHSLDNQKLESARKIASSIFVPSVPIEKIVSPH